MSTLAEFIGNSINLILTTKLFKILSNKLLDVATLLGKAWQPGRNGILLPKVF
jgi:hypothetical protein